MTTIRAFHVQGDVNVWEVKECRVDPRKKEQTCREVVKFSHEQDMHMALDAFQVSASRLSVVRHSMLHFSSLSKLLDSQSEQALDSVAIRLRASMVSSSLPLAKRNLRVSPNSKLNLRVNAAWQYQSMHNSSIYSLHYCERRTILTWTHDWYGRKLQLCEKQ